jgi:hypothetical protein
MAYQLVYTSAAKLLDAGRSGFGTVARSKPISSLVVSAIERASQFANLRGLDRSRAIHVHRRITAGSSRFHVLSRIVDAGVDYTGRTNHIAHHLVVTQEEANKAASRGVTPADVLRQFPWLDRWEGSARYFDSTEDIPLDVFRADGKNGRAQYWATVTGNPAHARLLSWDASPRTGVLIVPEGANPLSLMAEALAECGAQSWSHSFTTSLETTDELADLDWIVSAPHSYPDIQPRCGTRTLWDLSAPATLPVPPAPSLPAPHLAAERKLPGQIAHTVLPRPSGVQPRGAVLEPVKVRSFHSESEEEDVYRASSRARKSKNKHPLLLAGACVALVATLVIAVLLVKKQKVRENEAPIAQVPDEKQEAIKRLTRDGELSEKGAEEIVNALERPKDSEEYANFINNFLPRIRQNQKINSIGDLKLLDHPVNEISKNPECLNELIKAKNEIAAFWKNDSVNQDLLARFKKIEEIKSHLDKSVDPDFYPRFDKTHAKSFRVKLMIYELEKLFNVSNAEVIKNSLGSVKNTEFKNDVITLSKDLIKPPDKRRELIMKAIDELAAEEKIIGKSVASAPNESKNPSNDKNLKPSKPQPAKKTIDVSGLKQWEITLLKDVKELSEVQSRILQKVLATDSGKDTPLKFLGIIVDGKAVENLSEDPTKTFYQDNWRPTLKVIKDGKIEVIKKWKQIEINLKYNSKTYYHFIVVSNPESKDKKQPVIPQELRFEIIERSPDVVIISGESVESLMGNKFTPGLFKFKHGENLIAAQYLNSIGEPMLTDNGFFIQRIPEVKRALILGDEYCLNLSQSLKDWDKESNKDEKRIMREKTFDLLKESIGHSYVLKENEKFNRKILDDPEEVKKLANNFSVTNAAKDNILKEIGNSKINEVYDLVMKGIKIYKGAEVFDTWEKMEDLDKGDVTKINSIRDFMDRSKKPIPRDNYKKYLSDKLTQITVETEYRLLFTAKLKEN